MAEAAPNADVTLKCLKDKKVPIAVVVLVAALLLAIIALAAKKCPSCPSCPSPTLPSCLENGIGYAGKCFYFVEAEAGWNRSREFCRSLGARLATVDAREELGFLSRYGGSSQHWVGLWREGSGPWKWLNGSIFNDAFGVRGDGHCAYVDADGIGSARCSHLKPSICSHPQRRQKGPQILRNST